MPEGAVTKGTVKTDLGGESPLTSSCMHHQSDTSAGSTGTHLYSVGFTVLHCTPGRGAGDACLVGTFKGGTTGLLVAGAVAFFVRVLRGVLTCVYSAITDTMGSSDPGICALGPPAGAQK